NVGSEHPGSGWKGRSVILEGKKASANPDEASLRKISILVFLQVCQTAPEYRGPTTAVIRHWAVRSIINAARAVRSPLFQTSSNRLRTASEAVASITTSESSRQYAVSSDNLLSRSLERGSASRSFLICLRCTASASAFASAIS